MFNKIKCRQIYCHNYIKCQGMVQELLEDCVYIYPAPPPLILLTPERTNIRGRLEGGGNRLLSKKDAR